MLSKAMYGKQLSRNMSEGSPVEYVRRNSGRDVSGNQSSDWMQISFLWKAKTNALMKHL